MSQNNDTISSYRAVEWKAPGLFESYYEINGQYESESVSIYYVRFGNYSSYFILHPLARKQAWSLSLIAQSRFVQKVVSLFFYVSYLGFIAAGSLLMIQLFKTKFAALLVLLPFTGIVTICVYFKLNFTQWLSIITDLKSNFHRVTVNGGTAISVAWLLPALPTFDQGPVRLIDPMKQHKGHIKEGLEMAEELAKQQSAYKALQLRVEQQQHALEQRDRDYAELYQTAYNQQRLLQRTQMPKQPSVELSTAVPKPGSPGANWIWSRPDHRWHVSNVRCVPSSPNQYRQNYDKYTVMNSQRPKLLDLDQATTMSSQPGVKGLFVGLGVGIGSTFGGAAILYFLYNTFIGSLLLQAEEQIKQAAQEARRRVKFDRFTRTTLVNFGKAKSYQTALRFGSSLPSSKHTSNALDVLTRNTKRPVFKLGGAIIKGSYQGVELAQRQPYYCYRTAPQTLVPEMAQPNLTGQTASAGAGPFEQMTSVQK